MLLGMNKLEEAERLFRKVVATREQQQQAS